MERLYRNTGGVMTRTGFFQKQWPVFAALAALLIVMGLTLKPYDWNVSALIHTDEVMHTVHPLPPGFAVLEVPAYDGSRYYQMARDMEKVFAVSAWPELVPGPPPSYSYQRILLPLTAFILSFGYDAALPYVFLLLNIACLTAACALIWKWQRLPLAALAFALCPSAMVGLHFSLAEPLALLLIALFLMRYCSRQHIGWIEVLLLSLLVLSREVNILFVGAVFLHCLYRKNWKDIAMLGIPVVMFVGLHAFIYLIFREVPFLMSAGARQLPGAAIMEILIGRRGYDMYTLSSVALFLGFVLPSFIWSIARLIRGDRTYATIALFLFLCLMFTMPDYIWGSITSIGRVITPVYPLAVVAFAQNRTRLADILTLNILLLGLGAGLGLALIVHPYFLA